MSFEITQLRDVSHYGKDAKEKYRFVFDDQGNLKGIFLDLYEYPDSGEVLLFIPKYEVFSGRQIEPDSVPNNVHRQIKNVLKSAHSDANNA